MNARLTYCTGVLQKVCGSRIERKPYFGAKKMRSLHIERLSKNHEKCALWIEICMDFKAFLQQNTFHFPRTFCSLLTHNFYEESMPLFATISSSVCSFLHQLIIAKVLQCLLLELFQTYGTINPCSSFFSHFFNLLLVCTFVSLSGFKTLHGSID